MRRSRSRGVRNGFGLPPCHVAGYNRVGIERVAAAVRRPAGATAPARTTARSGFSQFDEDKDEFHKKRDAEERYDKSEAQHGRSQTVVLNLLHRAAANIEEEVVDEIPAVDDGHY